jgi:hypothetical protein
MTTETGLTHVWVHTSPDNDITLFTTEAEARAWGDDHPSSSQRPRAYEAHVTGPLPQVYVNLSDEDGIAEVTVTRGEVEFIVQDWNALHDGGWRDYEHADLIAMRDKLAGVALPEYRDRLLADIQEFIDESAAERGINAPDAEFGHSDLPTDDQDPDLYAPLDNVAVGPLGIDTSVVGVVVQWLGAAAVERGHLFTHQVVAYLESDEFREDDLWSTLGKVIDQIETGAQGR